MGLELDSLEVRVQSQSESAAAGLDKLISSLTQLRSAAKGGAGLSSTVNQLTRLSNALGSLGNTKGLANLAAALQPLQSVQKASGFTSTVNALKKLPEITKALSSQELQKFGAQIKLVAKYMAPLATEMEKVSKGFSAFPVRIQKIIQGNSGLAASNKRTASSFGRFNSPVTAAIAKLTAYGYVVRRIVSFLADSVMSINEYVENVNLFQVAMGDYYDEAFAYAQLVNEKLGIDPSQWMRTQGVFQSIANGFGIAQDQAYALSEGLTELSYDLSSLYNEDMESSALRLQSALAGEIEPIRRLGISITEATLKEFALSKGITKSVESMTEQEKALLRTIKLMEGAANIGAIGDFARTLESPANALRVLNQQITQFKRAIGSVMLPVLVQVIPYVQAFVELLTEAISALAVLVGFTMPEWDASDWGTEITSGASTATDAVEGTTAAVKELKNATLGIDELNILAPSGGGSGSGAGGGSGSNWAADLEIPDIWDKAQLEAMTSQVDEIKKKMKPVLDLALAIGAALLAWKIAKGLASGILGFKTGLDAIKAALGLLLGGGALSAFQSLLAKIAAVMAACVIQFNAAGGGLAGVLAVVKMLAAAAAPWVALLFVIASTLKVLIQRWADIKAAVTEIFDKLGISDRLQEMQDKLDALGLKLGWVDGFWQGLKDTIGALMDFVGGTVITILGSSLIGALNALIEVLSGLISILNGALDIFTGLAQFLVGVFTGDLQKVEAGVDQMGLGIQEVFGGLWQAVVGGVTEFVNGVLTAVSNLGGTLIHEKFPEILQGFTDWWGDIVDFFNDSLPRWWRETISPWFTVEKWKSLGTTAISGLMSGLNTIKDKLTGWASDAWSTVKNKFGSLKDNVTGALSDLGGTLSIDLPSFSGYASGGFPDAGQLFLANEAGPELVGRIGRQTAVANSDQIVSGIAYGVSTANEPLISAVYAAAQQVIRAVEAGGDVYMDGYKVGRRTTKAQNRQNRVYGATLQNV